MGKQNLTTGFQEDATAIELKNIDPDDISDILVKVEMTLDIEFGKTELVNVKTFGELCDIVVAKISGVHVEDCTTQQCFYKLRNAIAATLLIDKRLISPDTELQQLFPRNSRRKRIKEMQHILEMPVDILDIREWLGWTIFGGVVLSLIMVFFTWYMGLGGLATFIGVGRIASKYFAKEFELATVGQLAEKLARENYRRSRRDSSTINRNEIAQKVRELFEHDLDWADITLTRESAF